ncbi:MAG: BMP family ABC transporter substrate-binding protein [Defluviitaleaceae bacterium]|nr:BMP family ABC transporter substrate-binding protein [Defluviitaleaceae bacterium]
MKIKTILGICAVAFLAACSTDSEEIPTGEGTQATSDIQIALIAHSPDSILDDGSFNEGAWQGIQRFMNRHNLSSNQAAFFQPHEASDVARIDLIAGAIDAGANVLVLPGFHFQSALYEAQDLFPNTKFILLDASPMRDGNVRIEDNLVAIHYAEHEAGFLAGYAAVVEGYRDLGFMGGIAVPAVVRFGHGFIQGAEHAAASLGLSTGEVTITYHYLGQFSPDPAITTTAAAWFASGTEVIFVAAGGAGFSVFSAAETSNASTIGVDVDQSGDSDSVITSAIKGLDVSVYDMITAVLNDNFPGGQEFIYDASIHGIGLTMDTARFNNFTQTQYEVIFTELASGSIYVSSSLEMEDINTTLVIVTEL